MKEKRKEFGYTKEQVANYLNCTINELDEIENRNMNSSQLDKLLSLYHTDLKLDLDTQGKINKIIRNLEEMECLAKN
jgi:transcriptional regulator with XRE-family HTH domain